MNRIPVVGAVLAILIVAGSTAVGQAAPAPATRSSLTGICRGEVRFTLPAGWKEITRGRNDLAIELIYDGGPKGLEPRMIVMGSPADIEALRDPQAGAKLGQKLIAKRKATAGENHIDFVHEPALVPDKRFLFKISEQYKDGDRLRDQQYAARRVGGWVVTVVVRTDAADADLLAACHKTAERFLDSMIPGIRQPGEAKDDQPPAAPDEIALKPQKAVLPKARLSIPLPDGWKEELHDGKDGIVAVMRDPLDGTHMLVISVRVLPPEAAKDAKMRDLILDELAKSERVTFKLEGGEQAGPPATIRDERFLRKSISEVKSKDVMLKLDSRQRLVGERLVSVSSISLDADYQRIADLADRVATGIE